jgi:hypothetical protein
VANLLKTRYEKLLHLTKVPSPLSRCTHHVLNSFSSFFFSFCRLALSSSLLLAVKHPIPTFPYKKLVSLFSLLLLFVGDEESSGDLTSA